ncbi:putative interferon-induced very large GTPase 1-like, partial [Apostichopus japonicus]
EDVQRKTEGRNETIMETENPDEDDVKDAATSTTSQQNIDKMDGNIVNNNRVSEQQSSGIDESISEYLDEVGLKKYFPQKLTLKEATEVRLFPKNLKETGKEDLPFLFISKLTSLDSRITWKENLNINGSVRDFIYALLQCSDNHLRQHLMEKLASCQLALPILLPGVRDDAKPELLTWAISRVVKNGKKMKLLLRQRNVWDEYSTAIQDIKKRFKNVNVIHLIAKQDRKGKGKRETRRPKHEVSISDENYSVGDSVMFKLDRGDIELSKIICKHIAHYCKDTSDEEYISIETWKLFCFNEVTIDQDNPSYKTAKDLLKCLFPVTESIEKVKNSYLQLQEGWVEWVKADKKPLSVGDQDANFQLAAKDTIKINLRNKQAEKGLSEKMQGFLETLQQVLIDEEEDTLHYFMLFSKLISN